MIEAKEMNDGKLFEIKKSLNELTLSLDAINEWAELSRDAKSHGWNERKLDESDIIVTTNTINIIGLDVVFTGLFIFNRNTFTYNKLPQLVKMKVNK